MTQRNGYMLHWGFNESASVGDMSGSQMGESWMITS